MVEEIEAMHSLNLEWGCLTNLMDKISNIEDKIEGGWSEMIDMVADAVTEEGENKDPVSAFFSLYQFLFRLYYRLKANPEKRPFNQVSKVEISGEEVYRVMNYDYKYYKWARANGHGMYISNAWLDIYSDKLTTNQRAAFDRRCKR